MRLLEILNFYNKKDFRKLLKSYRKRSGINKANLSRKLGVSDSYIMLVESGDRLPPRADILRRMIDVLKLDKEESLLFLDSAIQERTPSHMKDLILLRNKVSNQL